MANPRLEVLWWDGALVGHLVQRGTIYFVYDQSWVASGHNLSPLHLPLTTVAFNGVKGVEGLPGLIADCLPDTWGRKVAAADFAQRKLGEVTAMKLLAWRGARGLGALQFRPALGDDGRPLDRPLAAISVAALARGAGEIQRGAPSAVLPQLVRGGTAGGAYPKALVLAYADGTLGVGQPDGVGEPCLLKFDLSDSGGTAACEHAYALMSAAAGIRTVSTRLIDGDQKGQRPHLLVRRFDVPDPRNPQRRLHFHSLSGLLHQRPGELDYRDFFHTAIQLGAPPADVREIARRMIFNVLAANPDDHGKNHAFVHDEASQTWSLSPAFDVTFRAGMLERGLRVSGEVWPRRDTMEALCRDAGVRAPEFRNIFSAVESAIKRWPRFARQAGVPAPIVRDASDWQRRIRVAVVP